MTKDELTTWRKARGLTQAQLAELAGVTRVTVVRWEKGEHAIPFDLLTKLEAQSPSIKAAAPAVKITRRMRPFPWGERDYSQNEIDHMPVGAKVWRMDPAEADPQWVIKVYLATRGYGKSFFRDRCEVTLPPEAFPDPLGKEAKWAREMFDARMAAYNASFRALRDAFKESGIPDDDT